jgi:uncharacterized protein YrrD
VEGKMKLRNLKNLPVLYLKRAQVLGRVEKGVIDDNFNLLYLVVKTEDETPLLIFNEDFMLNEDSVKIFDPLSMKSYSCGEGLSMNELKMGDRIFSQTGRELGLLSDFIIDPHAKKVLGVEISGGIISDFITGRREVPLSEIYWASSLGAVIN